MKNIKKKSSRFITLIRSIKLVYKCAPVTCMGLVVFIIINSIVPSLHILLIKYIIDTLVSVNVMPMEVVGKEVIYALSLWGGLHFLSSFSNIVYNTLQGELSDKVVKHINSLIIMKSSALKDLYSFEDPAYYDDLNILKTQSSMRPVNLVGNIALNLKNLVTILSMIGVLFSIHYLVPIILLVTLLPHVYVTNKFHTGSWLATLKTSKESRKMNYFSSLMLSKSQIKEVQLFDLGNFFLIQYLKNFAVVYKEKKNLRNKQALLSIPSLLFNIAGNIIIFYFIIKNIMINNFTHGTIVVFVQVLSQINYYLFDLIQFSSYLNTILLYFDKLFNFLNWKNLINEKSITKQIDTLKIGIIEFRSVSFQYPNSDNFVLKNVSFTLNPKQKLAIVGENGAGKSTLIKLLLRYYEPTSGMILYEGHNINEYGIDNWRKNISAVFQDYGVYHLSLMENIGLSDIPTNNIIDKQKCLDVCKELGFNKFIDNDIKDCQLGKEFGGIELSGGEWQRLAVARAFFRNNAKLIILDEPTAALDPMIEAQIYEDFSRLSSGKTSIMITHRLGSVTQADNIIVLKNGNLIEEGVHEALICQESEYAKMFNAQAKQYKNKKIDAVGVSI